MTDIQQRVAQCFLTVFPALTAAEVPRASQATLPKWDSVANVTLLSAIAEEFGIELDDEAFESLTSYALVVDFVERRLADQAQ
jgi:acyl carrier protein